MAKYLVAAKGRDVLSVAKKSDCHAPCTFLHIFSSKNDRWFNKKALSLNLKAVISEQKAVTSEQKDLTLEQKDLISHENEW